MSGQILYTSGGMALTAKHRRLVRPAYETGADRMSRADCNNLCDLPGIDDGFCPRHEPDMYARAIKSAPARGKAKHRSEVTA